MPIRPTTDQPLRFHMPLSAARQATEEEGGGVWMPVLPIGTRRIKEQWPWLDLDELTLTADDLQQAIDNHRAGIPWFDLSLNEDHNGGRALGWIADLRVEADGLWARVEPTPLGAQLLADKSYRYTSAEFFPFVYPFRDPGSGRQVPNVLIAHALTNRPFYPMPAVASASSAATIPPGDTIMPESLTAEQRLAALETQMGELRTQNAALTAENTQLKADQQKVKDDVQRGAIKARFAGMKGGDGKQLAPAHIEQLAAQVMDHPADKRDALMESLLTTLKAGIVETGERGSAASGAGGKELTANDRRMIQALGITEETFRKYNSEYA